MTATGILFVYVALVIIDLAWGLFLTVLNYRGVRTSEGRVPEELAAVVKAEEAAKSRAYSLARMRLSLVETAIMTALSLAAVLLGLFGALDRAIASMAPGAYLHAILFLGAVLSATSLLSAPFSLWSTFRLEKRFGFNTTTMKTWLLDAGKGALLSLVIGLPLLWLLFAFMDVTGGLWWLWAAAIFSLVDVLLSLIHPLLVAPLFNRFSPLAEGMLATRIREMAERLDFRMSGIFVMDGSRRSRHSNAYFTGLGAVKRVVLFDTLVTTMSEDEILAVLAHEIGHEKKRHVLKTMALSIVFAFAAFWALSLLAGWPALYAAFGFRGGAAGSASGATMSKHAILLIFALVSGPATFFLTPLFSAFSRRHEYEADRFAAAAALRNGGRGAEALASALIRLDRENASNLWPHPLFSFWYYSHPTLRERLAAIHEGEGGDAQRGKT